MPTQPNSSSGTASAGGEYSFPSFRKSEVLVEGEVSAWRWEQAGSVAALLACTGRRCTCSTCRWSSLPACGRGASTLWSGLGVA